MNRRSAPSAPPAVRIVVASANPVKLEATRRGFALALGANAALDLVALPVDAGVAEQPIGDPATRHGARARAEAVRLAEPRADYWVGLEGGVDRCAASDETGSADAAAAGVRLFAFAWVAIRGAQSARWGESRTANVELPPAVVSLVDAGLELGAADDRVFGRDGSKQREGAVGLLTGGVLDRAALYAPAVTLALVPFLRRDLFG